ncbi:sperm-tail PG-rich repeat-containing protein 2 [Mustelus asterias]
MDKLVFADEALLFVSYLSAGLGFLLFATEHGWNRASPHSYIGLPLSSQLVPTPSATAPSIPSSNQSFGYEEAEDGALSRHLPPSRDGILGPAYYNPQYGIDDAQDMVTEGENLSLERFKIDKEEVLNRLSVLKVDRELGPDIHLLNLSSIYPLRSPYCLRSSCCETFRILGNTALYYVIPPCSTTLRAQNEPYPTRQYKGVHFGNRTSKRIEFKIPEGPGPGTYDLLKDHTVYCENLNMKNKEQKYESYVPRFLDAIVQKEEKQGFPGPAEYEIKGLFDEKTPLLEKVSPSHPPFLSHTKRFLPVKSITPAPGWYDDPRTALQTLKRISTKSRSPFGQNAARFVEDLRAGEEPGPGTYNVTHHTLARESQRKANFESPIRGGFGSTVPRLQSTNAKQKMPGPADYKIQEKSHHYHRKLKTSSFASMTERIPVTGPQNNPAPGSYDVHRSYERTQGRGQCAPSEFMCNSFLTTVPRNVKIARQSADKPGPGAYKPILKSTPKMALIVSRQPRFKDPNFHTPGPADYELSPSVMDSVLKGTFNATLINPLLNSLPVPSHPDPPLFQDI